MDGGPRTWLGIPLPIWYTFLLDLVNRARCRETDLRCKRKEGQFEGLVIAEVDFGPNGDPSSLTMPSFAVAEVTDNERFTEVRLALTTCPQVKTLLDEFNAK